MKAIEISELQLSGIDIEGVFLDFQMDISPNRHASAKIVIKVMQEPDISQFTQLEDTLVCVTAGTTTLFAGYCKAFCHKKDGVYHTGTLELELISASCLVDRKKEKRSFQNIKMNYREIMEEVLARAECRLTYFAQDKTQRMPLIQYNETAWEFVRRLASHLSSCVYPDYKNGNPVIMVSFPDIEFNGTMNLLSFKHSFSERYWEVRQEEDASVHNDYIYYDLTSYEDVEIGTWIHVNGEKKLMLSKKARTDRGEIIFSYKAGSMALAALSKYYNPVFAGMGIKGSVLSTSKETLRVKFDFDQEQNAAEAYDYMWVPECGNTMYLMPRIGTTVNLFFKNESEESAVAVSCIRMNGQNHDKMSDCANRYFTNESDKQMSLKPDRIEFVNQSTEDGIVTDDVSGVKINSSNCISLVSQKKIIVEAKNILISTPNELLMQKITL